ncbi:MAG: acetyl-CoA C-acyltransferase [Legionella sp.]|jgi:acetyl-CoA C-acetyltransferase|nr:acetyl-CoA C-acyltransferase [Legionella sp.]
MKPNNHDNDVVIVAASRTPSGNLLGSLSSLTAPELGAVALKASLEHVKIAPELINEVLMGCVLPAGLGQAPARQAALKAGIPHTVGATTLNKMCGSGMKAVMLAHDLIQAKTASCVLAGGMENMSRAPYLVPKARAGYRLGHGELLDHLCFDGLEDAYEPGQLMGVFADRTAKALGITREVQDEFAARSMQRALDAQAHGAFTHEIAPITITTRQGDLTLDADEGPDASKLEKLSRLRPAFSPDGTVTAGNASSIADGAASLLLMTASMAEHHGIKPLARIKAHATHAGLPEQFTTAPIGAIQKVLDKAGWQARDVDLYEINEAFAVVTLAAVQALKLKINQVNIHGGACALGHPIGASGARILVTLIHALKQTSGKKGVAALCIGGGEATAIALECF